ncbi:MAG: 3-isopropylmalate dehydratase [Myxococcales bacterium]|nr:3-isopropylmalate dehydratase [Myxococcales bacterium]
MAAPAAGAGVASDPAPAVRFGPVLYLTEDPAWIRRQLDGERLPPDHGLPLRDAISTDEITPGWVCFHYDETLGQYCLVGLAGSPVGEGDLARAGFEVLVSGRSKGCGSSRETAPFSELCAGIRLVVAESFEKIYAQNAENLGLLTSTDFALLPRIARGEPIPLDAFIEGRDALSAGVVAAGGLFAYNRARLRGAVRVPTPPARDASRPMTLAEKILARHVVVDPSSPDSPLGVPAVAPGDAVFARTDVRFSHEYVTPMAETFFRHALGPDARVRSPERVYAFRDHLTFLDLVMPEERRKRGLLQQANGLATTQETFARRHGVRLYGVTERGGAEAICHNAVVEEIASPGELVIGTDSHTCMAGVLGCLAFGVGSTDMANAWYTQDVRVRVPHSVRVELRGRLRRNVTAKDVMLHLLAAPFVRGGHAIGAVLEFAGEGLADLPLDERATLTNMSVEAGAMTGLIAPDAVTFEHLRATRGLDDAAVAAIAQRAPCSDEGATYAAQLTLDCGDVEPMVATPGDPRSGRPLARLGAPVRIDIAYGGSCTGGKRSDMDLYARVFADAEARGRRIAPGVECFIQFGSRRIREYAERMGYVELFERVGVTALEPSCGACINAGPGASRSSEQVTVSAQNRNFPGRSGPGSVYLASPLTVAASALAGHIVSAPE